MIDRVGQLLGNYRLTRLLGRGGYADVYLGEHIYLRTQAALKILQIQLTHESIEDFLTEARTLVQLEHPHIVRVLECGVEDHTPFLVMSYAPGGSLRQRCPRGTRLNPQDLVSYVTQIASALQYAHERKLIHRDIKPENILLGSNNEILLSDFGLVLTAQSSGSQVTKEMVGTVPYMAPEQLQGKPRPASDQYALGIMVYEWLSGKRPFQGTFIEIASQHMLAPPSPLYGHIPGVSSEIERVLFTALAKDPARRFNSVQDFALALQRAYHTMLSGPVALSASSSVIDQSSQPTYVHPLQENLASQSPPGVVPSGQAVLPTNLNTPSSTQPTYVHPLQENLASQSPSGVIPSGQAILPTNLNTPPSTQPTYVHHPPTQSSQPTYVYPPRDNLPLPLSHPGLVQSGRMIPANNIQTARVVPLRQRGLLWSLISLLSVILLLLVILGSLVLIPGISKTLGFNRALPTPSPANTGILPTQVATATPTPISTPTPVPTQAYANAPTATPQPKSTATPTPTPTVAYAAFQITSIDMSVNPTSIQGTTCGSYLTVTYTATFHAAANSPGGVVQFNYTINNGRGESTDSITFASGQTTKTYSFTWSGNLPADHTYPEPGGVMSTSPNSVTSELVGPTGQCS